MSFTAAFRRPDRTRSTRAQSHETRAAASGRDASIFQQIDWTGWRRFVIAILALAFALVLALFSSSAAQAGRLAIAATSAFISLGIAGWVAITIVPALARRTSIEWFSQPTDYRLTREGGAYLAGIFIVALAALNTGNNLLFMVLACLIAGILVSGVISQIVLRDIQVRLEMPPHIFAGQPVVAVAELVNRKRRLPSFSLSLVAARQKPSWRTARKTKQSLPQPVNSSAAHQGASANGRSVAASSDAASNNIFTAPVYFPYLPSGVTVQQRVQMTFPRRGVYRQESLGLQTRFPFGFLEKTRPVDSGLHAIVYPSVEPTQDFYELLPQVTGEIESFLRGRGSDLYSIRDYLITDTARHVDWKASAKSGALQVREFAREDERRVMLVFDPSFDPSFASAPASAPHAPAAPPSASSTSSASSARSRSSESAASFESSPSSASPAAAALGATMPHPRALNAAASDTHRYEQSIGQTSTAHAAAAHTQAATRTTSAPTGGSRDADAFERGVALCASLAWHFHQLNSVLMFSTAGFETRMAPAGEIIYDILGSLAVAEPRPATDGHAMLRELADSPHVFKIILTGQPRGSIPNSLWNSSYIIFLT